MLMIRSSNVDVEVGPHCQYVSNQEGYQGITINPLTSLLRIGLNSSFGTSIADLGCPSELNLKLHCILKFG